VPQEKKEIVSTMTKAKIDEPAPGMPIKFGDLFGSKEAGKPHVLDLMQDTAIASVESKSGYIKEQSKDREASTSKFKDLFG